ncbi:hypothetical protein H0E87_007370, partial [Populus deltoides]
MSNYNMKVSSSPKVSKHVECLRHLQSQHDELEAQFLEERKALEAKYNKLYQPLYTKRYEIVNGLKEVDGVMSAELDSIKEDQAIEEKGVPEFWLTAMKTHEVLAEEIKGQDEGALKFIKDIKWSRLQNPEGFELEFYFNPCPYFKNSVLTKTYHIIDESDPILSQAIGTEIEWYPEKCLTTKVVKRKQRMVSKKTKTTMTIKNCESFFTFFNPPHIPENEDDLDDDANDELQDRIEQDYNVGIIIRDKIIPHALSWFTREVIEDDKLEGIDYDDNDGGDGDDDDDEDEDEAEAEAEVEQEEKTKQEVKDIKEDHDEDEEEENERKWGLKKDDDEDEAEVEENNDRDKEDNESDKKAEQEEKIKQGVKEIKEDHNEDEEEENERKWSLKDDDDDDDDDDDEDEVEDEENNNTDEEDNESDKKAEQEEKIKQGVKKDIKKDHDEDVDEKNERKWGLKKDDEDEDGEAGDEENDDGDEEDNESDKEAEQEEKRKQGVKKDIKE